MAVVCEQERAPFLGSQRAAGKLVEDTVTGCSTRRAWFQWNGLEKL